MTTHDKYWTESGRGDGQDYMKLEDHTCDHIRWKKAGGIEEEEGQCNGQGEDACICTARSGYLILVGRRHP